MTGTLYVVATPLGNLGDLSTRAVRTLESVSLVAAEDTRRTRRLLSHLDVHPDLVSIPAFAEDKKAKGIVGRLEEGTDVALVTDAGTPTVSDPGARLVALARERGVPVVPIPGPTAVGAALSVSGLPADRHLFLGFLPRKGSARKDLLTMAASSPLTIVLYEAPSRLAQLLEDLTRCLGGSRTAVVARELTKVHEEVVSGTLDQLRDRFQAGVKGEVTVVVEGADRPAVVPPSEEVASEVARLVAQGKTTKDIVRLLTEKWGISRNEGYRLVTGMM